MYAVWWSVNKSIPQSFSMSRVLSAIRLLYYPFINLPVLCKQ